MRACLAATMMRAMPEASPDPKMRIFDRTLLRRRRDRAAASFGDYDFLLRRAGEDIVERIAAANRDFEVAADLGCHRGTLAQAIAEGGLPQGKIGMLVSSDMSIPMLTAAPAPRVIADEEALPFANGSLNLATCQAR